jgi:hypothetical protein
MQAGAVMSKAGTARIIARVLAGVLGGWVFVVGLVSIGITLLVRLGVTYGNAQTFMFLLGTLALLVAFLWAFAARQLTAVWLVLGGGGLVMTGAAWYVVHAIH